MMRAEYWTCSKFADWIRGAKKPYALGFGEWDDWKADAKIKHPIRFWIAEEGLDILQNIWMFIPDQLHKIQYYLNNRFVDKRHYLKTKLPPGQWNEFDTRILHGLFEELVDFIEVEKAHHHIAWGDKELREKYNTPRWCRPGFFGLRYRGWRSPRAGIDHLLWEESLVYDESCGTKEGDDGFGEPLPQAIAAKETHTLYSWWKFVRPNRPDPYEASGVDEYYDKNPLTSLAQISKRTDEEREPVTKMYEKCRVIQQEYDDEDTEMLIRLIKIRQNLWT